MNSPHHGMTAGARHPQSMHEAFQFRDMKNELEGLPVGAAGGM
jgi:hypothetical protein